MWLGLSCFALCMVVLFATLRFLETRDDPLSDAAHGDEPFISAECLKSLFHKRGEY